MNEIIEYRAINPLIVSVVSSGSPCSRGIPEGGAVGFNGDQVFCRNANDNWNVCLTPKDTFLAWVDNGDLKKKFFPEKKASETLLKKVAAYKLQAGKAKQGVPAGSADLS